MNPARNRSGGLRQRLRQQDARRAVLTGAVALLEALWLPIPVAIFVHAAGREAEVPGVVAVLAVFGLAFATARLAGDALAVSVRARAAALLGSAAVIVLMARIDLAETGAVWDVAWAQALTNPDHPAWRASGRLDHTLGVLALAAVWIRGGALGRADLAARGLFRPVLTGILVLTLGFLFGPGTRTLPRVEGVTIAFVGVALGATAFQNASRLGLDRRASLRGAGVAFFSTMAVMAVLVLLLLAVAALLIALVSGSGVDQPVLDVLFWLATAAVQLLIWVLTPLFWLIRAVFDIDPLTPRPPPPQDALAGDAERSALRLTDTAALVIRIVGISLAALLFAGLVLWYFRRRLRRARRTGADEERVSILGEVGPGDDLRAAWDALWRRLPGRRARAARREAPIARLYFAVLEDAAALGLERRPALTPLQFAPRLQRQFHSDLPLEIARRFSELRYAGRDTPEPGVRALAEAWGALRRQPDFARRALDG